MKEFEQDIREPTMFICWYWCFSRAFKNKGFNPKRVAMVRGTGMKIFDKGSFRTPLKFVRLMIAKGEKLNDFIRKVPNDVPQSARKSNNIRYLRARRP